MPASNTGHIETRKAFRSFPQQGRTCGKLQLAAANYNGGMKPRPAQGWDRGETGLLRRGAGPSTCSIATVLAAGSAQPASAAFITKASRV